jgi:hypothetical protein
MQNQELYIKELETLILETLLPVYERYHRDRGSFNYMNIIDPKLLKQVKVAKVKAKLLQ